MRGVSGDTFPEYLVSKTRAFSLRSIFISGDFKGKNSP